MDVAAVVRVVEVGRPTVMSGPLTHALLEAIRNAQTKLGKSLKVIAREAEVDYTSLCRFVARERDLRVTNVGKLASYFELSIAPSPDGRRSREIHCMFDRLSRRTRRCGGRIRISYFARHLVRQALTWDSSTTQGAIAKRTGIPAASLSELLRDRRYYLGLSSLDKLLSCYNILVVAVISSILLRRRVQRSMVVAVRLLRSTATATTITDTVAAMVVVLAGAAKAKSAIAA